MTESAAKSIVTAYLDALEGRDFERLLIYVVVGAPSPTWMVTLGVLPSRDTCTSLYIVGEGVSRTRKLPRRDLRLKRSVPANT
jgi:hypothetical protein